MAIYNVGDSIKKVTILIYFLWNINYYFFLKGNLKIWIKNFKVLQTLIQQLHFKATFLRV